MAPKNDVGEAAPAERAVRAVHAGVDRDAAGGAAFPDCHEPHDQAAELARLGHWIWCADQDQLIVCSPELARIHELTPGTFLRQFTDPRLIAATVVAEDRERYRMAIAAAMSHARAYEIEYAIKTRSGTLKEIREVGRPISGPDGKSTRFIAAVQDITELRRESEAELRRQIADLHKLNHQKDKLFSIIGHDLRSPFTSIIGFSDLLVTNARDLSHGQTVSYAQIVREAAIGVHDLLDNLLAWASFQIRDSAIKLAPLDMAGVVAASIEPLTHMAETKGITIANGIGDVMALGDEPLLHVVMRNLVCNGIKFARSGGVVELTANRVEVVKADGTAPVPMVRITVRDDGVGMSAAALSNLFDLERTVSVPGTRGETGTGMGLYLSRDIIARHGGTVTVESTAEGGTSFHFTLPAAP